MSTVERRSQGLLSGGGIQWALWAGVIGCVVGLSVLAAQAPAAAVGVLALVLLIPLVLRKPLLLVSATVVTAFVALPAALPLTFLVGGYAFRAYEPFLVAGSVYVIAKYPANRLVRRAEILLYGFVLLWSLVGLANGSGLEWIIADVRMLVYLALGFSIAGRLARTEALLVMVRLMLPVLWVSAAFTLLSSVAGLPISGREEFASLSLSSDAATRILSPATYPSVAVICVAIGMAIAGRVTFRQTLPWLLPALLIVGLSYSRNAIISIGIALLVGLIAARATQAWLRVAVYIAVALVVGGLAWVFLAATSALPFSAWAQQQLDSFVGRVIEGISMSAISTDDSARYRLEQENPYLLAAAAEQPIFGHGFGYSFKPLFTGRFASEEQAEALSRFAHNFYLWAWVKTGIVGLTAFLIATFWSGVMAIREGSTNGVGAAAALLGLLGASFVAPMPVGVPTGLLVGILAGVCAAMASPEDHDSITTKAVKEGTGDAND